MVPTREIIRPGRNRMYHSIGLVELDGGFTNMMTRLRMLVVYRNHLILLSCRL